ncbi:MAG TPA: phasin family protein [Stellaceae bacterium]
METKGRRASRPVGPPIAEPPIAEPPIAEPGAAEPPMAGPVEKPISVAEPIERSSAIPQETAAKVPDMTAPAPVDQAPADDPEALVPPPVLAAPPRLAAPQHAVAHPGGEAMAAFAEARRALADGVEALSEEVAGLARRSIETAARTAIEMLAVRTVADALAVNAGFARANLGNWVGSSAKFSELGIRLAAESARPFSERLAKGQTATYRAGT